MINGILSRMGAAGVKGRTPPDRGFYTYGASSLPQAANPAGAGLGGMPTPGAMVAPGGMPPQAPNNASGSPPGALGALAGRIPGPQGPPPTMPGGYAQGGTLRALGAVSGAGTGRSDEIDAKLSDGEYVIDAETVALLGDGSTEAGAKRLDEMRERIRAHKGRSLARGKFSPDAKRPEQYLKE